MPRSLKVKIEWGALLHGRSANSRLVWNLADAQVLLFIFRINLFQHFWNSHIWGKFKWHILLVQAFVQNMTHRSNRSFMLHTIFLVMIAEEQTEFEETEFIPVHWNLLHQLGNTDFPHRYQRCSWWRFGCFMFKAHKLDVWDESWCVVFTVLQMAKLI